MTEGASGLVWSLLARALFQRGFADHKAVGLVRGKVLDCGEGKRRAPVNSAIGSGHLQEMRTA